MICNACGTQNPEKNRFCTHCGGRVGAAAPAKPAAPERTSGPSAVPPETARTAPRSAPALSPATSAPAPSGNGSGAMPPPRTTGSRLTDFFLALEWQTVAYFVVVVAAVFTHFYDLGFKPLHHDESIHAYYSYNLFMLKGYSYDPTYHGPFLYHANALVYLAFGVSDVTCRLVPAVFGMILVVLPFFFREWLGKSGALMVAILMTVSPTVTYVSRFIRDDIYQEACAFIMLMCFFKYYRQRKRWLLYVASAALAISFASMEATYITMFTFGTFLFLWYLRDTKLPPGHWPLSICAGLSVVVTLCIMTVSWGRHDLKFDFLDGETIFKYAAMAGVVFGLLYLVYRSSSDKRNDFLAQVTRSRADLAKKRDYVWYLAVFLGVVLLVCTVARARFYPDGIPLSIVIALVPTIVIGLLLAAIAFYFEDVEMTFWAAMVFAAIYVPLFSVFFTQPKGLVDGVTSSLTYWVLQHGVKRGNQPLNFYPFLTLVYELAPALFALLGTIHFALKRNVLANAFMWWLVLSAVIYSWAGEKMPWLLIHIAVPAIFVAGYYMGVVLDHLNTFRRFVLVPIFVALCGYGVHAMVPLCFYHPADPVEPHVYTQSSDDVKQIVSEIERISYAATGGKEIHMTIGSEATWPFPWYLRDYKFIAYPHEDQIQPAPGTSEWNDTPILIFQEHNQANAQRILGLIGNRYTVRKFHHRVWWIIDFGKIVPGFVDIQTLRDFEQNLAGAQWGRIEWMKLWKYLMYRELWNEKGSVDMYFCVRKDLEHKFD